MPAPPPISSQVPLEGEPAEPVEPGDADVLRAPADGQICLRGVDVGVEDAAAVGAHIQPAVDAGVALDDGDPAVLVGQVRDLDPSGALVIGAEEAVLAADGAADEDGGITAGGGAHADADLVGGGDDAAGQLRPGGAAVGGSPQAVAATVT